MTRRVLSGGGGSWVSWDIRVLRRVAALRLVRMCVASSVVGVCAWPLVGSWVDWRLVGKWVASWSVRVVFPVGGASGDLVLGGASEGLVLVMAWKVFRLASVRAIEGWLPGVRSAEGRLAGDRPAAVRSAEGRPAEAWLAGWLVRVRLAGD